MLILFLFELIWIFSFFFFFVLQIRFLLLSFFHIYTGAINIFFWQGLLSIFQLS